MKNQVIYAAVGTGRRPKYIFVDDYEAIAYPLLLIKEGTPRRKILRAARRYALLLAPAAQTIIMPPGLPLYDTHPARLHAAAKHFFSLIRDGGYDTAAIIDPDGRHTALTVDALPYCRTVYAVTAKVNVYYDVADRALYLTGAEPVICSTLPCGAITLDTAAAKVYYNDSLLFPPDKRLGKYGEDLNLIYAVENYLNMTK